MQGLMILGSLSSLNILAYSYLGLKRYKEALRSFRIINDQTQYLDIMAALIYVQFLIDSSQLNNILNHKKTISIVSNTLQRVLMSMISSKMSLINQISPIFGSVNSCQPVMIKESLCQRKIKLMICYYELFKIEYQNDKQNPILLKISNYLREYGPFYAAGYSTQYILLMDQQRISETYALAEPLERCDDSILKYVTLAKIYRDHKAYTKAQQVLIKASQINELHEDIYLIERELYLKQGKYQQAYQTLLRQVQIEQENFIFVSQLVAPLISNFEYYRVCELLEFVDKDSNKFNELKLLMNLLSMEEQSDLQEQIFTKIKSLTSSDQVIQLYQGHFRLKQNNIVEAQNYYSQTLEQLNYKDEVQVQIINPNSLMDLINLLKEKAQLDNIQITNFNSTLQQYEINNMISILSVYDYQQCQDNNNIYKRFLDTIGYLLVQLVFHESQKQNCQFINEKFDIQVPYLEDLVNIILENVQKIYRVQYISMQKYIGYVYKGLVQLQNLFQSTEVFLNRLYQYGSENKALIIEEIKDINHSAFNLDQDIKSLYKIPFFYDPISRYGLISVVKMIGYYVDFNLCFYYDQMEDWFRVYLLKQNCDGYFKAILRSKTK